MTRKHAAERGPNQGGHDSHCDGRAAPADGGVAGDQWGGHLWEQAVGRAERYPHSGSMVILY